MSHTTITNTTNTMEEMIIKQRKAYTCQRCKKTGHNRRTCKYQKKPLPEGTEIQELKKQIEILKSYYNTLKKIKKIIL